MLKKIHFLFCFCLVSLGVNFAAFAAYDFMEEEIVESYAPQNNIEYADNISASAINNYNMDGSLFEQITSLEQEKVVIQLEKERAQLDLELERLNAEKYKLQIELDNLSGRAEQQQHELQAAKEQLEIQTEKLRKQREMLDEPAPATQERSAKQTRSEPQNVSAKYRLVNVVGIGNQLQATVEEIATGQNKRIAVGRQLDGYTVKSISLNDGIIFEKDGFSENLSVGK